MTQIQRSALGLYLFHHLYKSVSCSFTFTFSSRDRFFLYKSVQVVHSFTRPDFQCSSVGQARLPGNTGSAYKYCPCLQLRFYFLPLCSQDEGYAFYSAQHRDHYLRDICYRSYGTCYTGKIRGDRSLTGRSYALRTYRNVPVSIPFQRAAL